MKKLKIAQIIPHYYPSIGGVEKVAQDLCEGLASRGHDVTVFTTKRLQKSQKNKNLNFFEIINGVKIYRYTSIFSLGHMSFTPMAIVNLLKNKFDIIHMHSIRHPHTIYIPLLKTFKSFSLILQGHTHFSSTMLKTFLYRVWDRLLFRTLYRRIDLFLCLNEKEKENFISFGIDRKNIEKFYNPISESLFNNNFDFSLINKKYGLENRKVLLFLGQAHEGKRIDLIIRALPKILSFNRETTLLIAGPDFGNYPKLSKLADDLNVSNNIKFLGLLNEEEKELVLKRCDILILPSEYEAFGLVLAEAMACCKPVIATKTPGPLELIKHGENGFLIERNSSDSIVNYVIKLMNDENLYNYMSRKARDFAEKNFRASSLVDKLELIYINLNKQFVIENHN